MRWARRTSVFAKRTLFLGLPSLVLYANMLFVLGDMNAFLAALRDKAFNDHHYCLYRMLARSALARTPSAHFVPYLLDEWAELEYQAGDRGKAEELMKDNLAASLVVALGVGVLVGYLIRRGTE